MARLLQSLRRALGLSSKLIPSYRQAIDTNFALFREGDRAIIHGKNPILTKPLKKGQKTDVRRGTLRHDDIIGKRVRDLVQAHKGPEYRLSLPSLDEYVVLTPRLVTPIYAADANLIVSLLDIHVTPPAEGDEQPPLEILESGTGHGSLTLHLARAIHAANASPPPLPGQSQVRVVKKQQNPLVDAEEAPGHQRTNPAEEDPVQQQFDAWRSRRRAVIHTIDVSPRFSAHAEKIVRGFRRGIYAGNVDFHVGRAEDWIADQIQRRTKPGIFSSSENSDPFLSYAILDMPSAHLRIPHVAPILKRDGILAVFMPSVTQIGECVDLIRRQKLPFILERAVELGSGLSSGRLWDIRFAVKKSRADPSSWMDSAAPGPDGGSAPKTNEASESIDLENEAASEDEQPSQDSDSVLVCRPKVGTRIVGGGFVGIWRRIEDA
ncbi:tRNA (adenine-N(1)-)-methyltransferase [Paecilomyces variotii No. 5]|uniref:tRNA (adenine(58)-N(1))-methyltransferase catalytic subunit TRM61 n=1 Tax=Byssochlamys spectabilis (strain No. 5 / NBRC 109023) TaxID=1356009 RepID=V5FJ36_BYSSN|nr:tRNA (adenine-N(1)-)-methyltransferase [Paecilomyces variotii No. 5]